MNNGFVKLYGTILTSSVWMESKDVRLLWITMLALADKDGFVSAAVPGLAHTANLSLGECEAALRVLESPDPHSRTAEHDGRRIERADGGWTVLNRTKYRDLRTEKQVTDAERIKRLREEGKYDSKGPVDATRSNVALETETEVEKETTTTPFVYPVEFDLLWNAYPRKAGSNKKQTYRLYLGHLKAGIDFDAMHAGALRYSAYATAKGWPGTEFIKAAQVFFGRDQHFLLEWERSDLPKRPSPVQQASELRSSAIEW